MTRQRGFALLIVLWTLVLISLVVTHLASTGRGETRIAINLEKSAIAEAAADGATYEAIFHLLDNSKDHWLLVDSRHRLKLNEGIADITIQSEDGKINPNTADPALLAALIQLTGVEPGAAGRLGAAIADWREPGDIPRPGGAKLAQYQAAGMDHGPPGEPFQSIEELGRVLGMTPVILDAITPYLSLYQMGLPNLNDAAPIIRKAMQQAGQSTTDQELGSPGANPLTITTRVTLTKGGGFVRRAVVRLGANFERGYAVLAWDEIPA